MHSNCGRLVEGEGYGLIEDISGLGHIGWRIARRPANGGRGKEGSGSFPRTRTEAKIWAALCVESTGGWCCQAPKGQVGAAAAGWRSKNGFTPSSRSMTCSGGQGLSERCESPQRHVRTDVYMDPNCLSQYGHNTPFRTLVLSWLWLSNTNPERLLSYSVLSYFSCKRWATLLRFKVPLNWVSRIAAEKATAKCINMPIFTQHGLIILFQVLRRWMFDAQTHCSQGKWCFPWIKSVTVRR